VAHIGLLDVLVRRKRLVDLFEYAPSERRLLARAFDSEIVTACMNDNVEGPFDESQRRFTVSVEGDSGGVVVESQALVGSCLFSSQ